MERNEIDYYLHNVLRKQLQHLKVSNYGLYSILEDVKKHLLSIVKHWNDTDFLNAIFITVIEEGKFYEPIVDEKISCLIVLGIRNSLLEIIASVECREFGLAKPINNNNIREITSKAIEYFKDIDLDKLSANISIEEDYYKDIIQKYKNSYNALIQLGKCTDKNTEKEFNIVSDNKFDIEELNVDKDCSDALEQVIMSGVSEEFDDRLIYLLSGIKSGKGTFVYFDSFKYLSRNFEKILKILEFVITHNAMFITNNFLLLNNYVSRRKNIIRSSHGNVINIEALDTMGDISIKYKTTLEEKFQKD